MTFQVTLAKRGHLKSPILATRLSVDLIEQAERFFPGTAATFRHGGYRAFYAPGADVVQLPEPRDFRDAVEQSKVANGATEPTPGAATPMWSTLVSQNAK